MSTLLLWATPAVLLIGAIVALMTRIRTRLPSPANAPRPLSDEEKAKLDRLLRGEG